jgi:hypothetical protein
MWFASVYEFEAILAALRRLPLRDGVTDREIEEQAGRLWFAAYMAAGNEFEARGRRGRRKKHMAAFVTACAGGVYHALVGDPAPRTREGHGDGNQGRAIGPLVTFVADIFDVLHIEAQPARQVQSWLARSSRGKKVSL